MESQRDKIREYVLERVQQEYAFEEGRNVEDINFVEEGYVTSMGLIQFVVELEEKFGIRFTDAEMASCEFCTVKGLTDIIKKKQRIFIYGAGQIGRMLAHNIGKESVEGFIVSRGYRNSKNILELPVYEFDVISGKSDIPDMDKSDFFVYVTAQAGSNTITEMLEKGNIMYELCNSDEVFIEIMQKFHKCFLEERGRLVSDGREIDFGRFRILNPEHQKKSYQIALYNELGDLIYPVFGDMDALDEGTYENGDVALRKGDVVIDCGSNIGLFALYAASEGCTCYAFEPASVNSEYMEYAAGQFPKHITHIQSALSDCVKTVKFDISSSGNVCKIIDERETGEYEEVRCTSIDAYVRENGIECVDFIKADIEGAERDMLKGAKWVLAEYGPKLSICTYHLPDDKEILTKIIMDANPHYVIEYGDKKLYAMVPGKERNMVF